MRGGLWSSFSVPVLGIVIRVAPQLDYEQEVIAFVSVADWLPQ